MGKGIYFDREELALLHETLAYALKRTFAEGEKARLRDMISRIQERLLDPDGSVRRFGVTPPEVEAVLTASETYTEALDGQLAAEISRRKARRVRELVGRFRSSTGLMSTLRRLFGR